MQNKIYLGNDNPVVLNFTFTGDYADGGLSNFTDIEVEVGGETYSLSGTPDNVVVESDTQLRILIGDTTALDPGNYYLRVTGYSAVYDDGYVLCSQYCGPGRVKVLGP